MRRGGATGSTSSSTDVRFRLIGINHDNRADGRGKAGLTFQAIGYYNIKSSMNTTESSSGGWRDAILRKNLNDESTGTIWNAIQSTDFKNNIIPVLKTTNNNAYIIYGECRYYGCNYSDYNSTNTSNASSITVDKLYILSPSEMGMPIIRDYKPIYRYYDNYNDRYNYHNNVHYYDSNSYMNTIKSSSVNNSNEWKPKENYIYFGDTYQWWMLPDGNRTDNITDGSNSEQQAYHNTNLYSYCALITSSNPSTNKCYTDSDDSWDYYWLRSTNDSYFFGAFSIRELNCGVSDDDSGVVIAFSF